MLCEPYGGPFTNHIHTLHGLHIGSMKPDLDMEDPAQNYPFRPFSSSSSSSPSSLSLSLILFVETFSRDYVEIQSLPPRSFHSPHLFRFLHACTEMQTRSPKPRFILLWSCYFISDFRCACWIFWVRAQLCLIWAICKSISRYYASKQEKLYRWSMSVHENV